jgi:uncharacterized protein (DUF885 family)
MVGQLKIVELREKARAAQGSRFSLKPFHTPVLDAGSLPREILARQIDKHIGSASAP